MAKSDKESIPSARLGQMHMFDPPQELELKDAVEARRKKINLGGTDFRIDYHGERVWVHPTNGFVPCGWFLIEKIGDFSE